MSTVSNYAQNDFRDLTQTAEILIEITKFFNKKSKIEFICK